MATATISARCRGCGAEMRLGTTRNGLGVFRCDDCEQVYPPPQTPEIREAVAALLAERNVRRLADEGHARAVSNAAAVRLLKTGIDPRILEEGRGRRVDGRSA